MLDFIKILRLPFKHFNVSLNLNILETGLINIILLLIILSYASKEFLKPMLDERRKIVRKSVRNAEYQLNNAKEKLVEAQIKLNTSNLAIKKLKKEAIKTKKELLEKDALQIKKDFILYCDEIFIAIDSLEQKIFIEIKEEIIRQLLKYAVDSTKNLFNSKNQALRLTNRTIQNLRGKL